MPDPTDAPIEPVKPFNEQTVLWPLTTGYTILYLVMMVLDFALRERFTMPPGMMYIYTALLAAYAGDKEVRRWIGKGLPSKWGSVFVYLWFIFFAVAYIVKAIRPDFELPADLSKVCLQVLGIFFGTKASGKIYEMTKADSDITKSLATHEEKVLALIDERGSVSNKDVATFLGVSKTTAFRVLEKLEQSGKILQSGDRKSARYTRKEE